MEKVVNLDQQRAVDQAAQKARVSNYSSGAKMSSQVMPIEYPEAIRFETPVQPVYSKVGAMASIGSLMFMSLMSVIMTMAFLNPDMPFLSGIYSFFGGAEFATAMSQLTASPFAAWVWLPFAFTIFGSTLGWLFELALFVAGAPFQLTKSAETRFITQIRLLNLAPVATTIFFFTCVMTVRDPNLLLALGFISAASCAALGFGLFFGTKSSLVPVSLLGIQVAQIAIVVGASGHLSGDIIALLIGQSILQFAMLVVGTSTPEKSTLFHMVNTIAGMMLFAAIMTISVENLEFSLDKVPMISIGSFSMWALIATCLASIAVAARLLPDAFNNLRTVISNTVWSPLYFKLVSAERFPDPQNLSSIYNKVEPKTTPLLPYYQAHPLHLMQSLSIPAVADKNIEANVLVYADLVKQAKSAFKLIGFLDHNLPQANLNEPLKNKPRMAVWSDGQEYWPTMFEKRIFGATLPNSGQLAKTPRAALTAFEEGQLLAYLAESGVANPFLQPAVERGQGALSIDFTFLEKYETKPDYESYGGMAYFQVNNDTSSLELVSVVAPHTILEIAANPNDPEFRRAEQLVLASMYYEVISGKHLGEIHMTYNLVEVAMHNAFDAQKQYTHPFRTFMYLHFFSHELAEEMTTEHLVQEGAVFSQIFATTHNGMVNHLNDTYANFVYGVDEDFEARAAAMTMENGELLPRSCVKWELEYFNVWHAYTQNLINIMYPSDEAVRNDQYMQDFYEGLLQVLMQGLPKRYEQFQTRKGIARFAADTIHHTVVRHQVYGTTGIRAALDPRISTTQVPRDTGTPGVNEWRSLAFVALATGDARFTLLTGEKGKDFTYLLEGLDEEYQKPMGDVFKQLQQDLLALQEKWTNSVVEKDFNYNYFRALPAELHTGPGY